MQSEDVSILWEAVSTRHGSEPDNERARRGRAAVSTLREMGVERWVRDVAVGVTGA